MLSVGVLSELRSEIFSVVPYFLFVLDFPIYL
jgi:hypothetical protein